MMNQINLNKSGYVLIATMVMISMSLVLITAILNRTLSFSQTGGIFRQREQARTLALGAIQLGISQVNFIPSKKDKEKTNTREQKAPEGVAPTTAATTDKEWFKQLIRVVNRWQTVQLTSDKDGIDAEVAWYITAEQGKFSLNYLEKIIGSKKQKEESSQDGSEKKEITKEQSEQQEHWESQQFERIINDIVEKTASIKLLDVLRDLSQISKRELDDPSDLFVSQQMKSFKGSLFAQRDQQKSVNLFDLFTVWSNSGTLNPWLLSTSTAQTLGLSPKMQGQDHPVDVDAIVKQFKPYSSWSTDWDSSVGRLYGTKFEDIPQKIRQLFAMQFQVTAFSIVVEVKLDNIVQRICAIVEEQKGTEKTQKSDTTASHTVTSNIVTNKLFTITRLYWL